MERLRTACTQWHRRGWRISPLSGGVLACALLALILGLAVRSGTDAGHQTVKHLVGLPAPDFALPAVHNGQQVEAAVRLRDQRGHPALVVFFFSLCPHCPPTLESARAAASARASAGLRVLYVDSPAETASIASDYALRLGLDAPVLLDAGGHVAARFGVTLYPATILVDENGVVRGVWTGEVGEDTLAKAADSVLHDQHR